MTYKGKRNWRNLLKPRNPREKKKLGGMILSAVLALILVGFISLTAFFALAKFTTAKIMSKDMVPMASSQFYDINGDLISTVDSEEDRIPVSISKVPKTCRTRSLQLKTSAFTNTAELTSKGLPAPSTPTFVMMRSKAAVPLPSSWPKLLPYAGTDADAKDPRSLHCTPD